LAAAHSQWDMIEFLMRTLSQKVYIFESIRLIRHESIFRTHYRLHTSYECLEDAYQRADQRLPRSELAKYMITSEQAKGHDQGLILKYTLGDDCLICRMPLLDVEEDANIANEGATCCVYKLPCSHSFHGVCLQTWVHNHSTCPACRLDLTKVPNEKLKTEC
jgi:hypothetical protein